MLQRGGDPPAGSFFRYLERRPRHQLWRVGQRDRFMNCTIALTIKAADR